MHEGICAGIAAKGKILVCCSSHRFKLLRRIFDFEMNLVRQRELIVVEIWWWGQFFCDVIFLDFIKDTILQLHHRHQLHFHPQRRHREKSNIPGIRSRSTRKNRRLHAFHDRKGISIEPRRVENVWLKRRKFLSYFEIDTVHVFIRLHDDDTVQVLLLLSLAFCATRRCHVQDTSSG